MKTHTRPRGYIADYRPQAKTRALLNDVTEVLNQYRDYWPLTVRQIFYRLVGAFAYPKTEAFYSRVCEHVANARRGRLIQFSAIRDDGISVMRDEHFVDADDFYAYVRELGVGYRRDLMARQPYRIEVWCEAAGMVPQLATVAGAYSIPVYSSSGFDSLTAKKGLADRIARISRPTVILHLGDCDPSGESIFRSMQEDVRAFVQVDRTDARISVNFTRVALTPDQVDFYQLPTSPAKASDSRTRAWQGETCQLEALEPDVLADLLRTEIEGLLDRRQLGLDHEAEVEERRRIAFALPPPSAEGSQR